MLIGLTKGLRFRLAMAFAAFAAFCFVAPPAVLAFGHGSNTLDCLAHADKVNHGKAQPSHTAHQPDHAPAAHHAPQHEDPGSADGHQMTCCGLFCLSALAGDCAFMQQAPTASAPYPARASGVPTCLAERLDRPPISLVLV
jgi:hypothetical protein